MRMEQRARSPGDKITELKHGQRKIGYYEAIEDVQRFLLSEVKVSKKKIVNYIRHLITIKQL